MATHKHLHLIALMDAVRHECQSEWWHVHLL